MFWESKESFDILQTGINEEELDKYCKKKNIHVDEYNNKYIENWLKFGYWYGNRNKLDPITCTGFAYTLTSFMTGLPVTNPQGVHFQEDNIDENIFTHYKHAKEILSTEFELRIELVHYILELYKEKIYHYLLRINRGTINYNYIDEYFLNQVEGNSYTDKVMFLLDFYMKNREKKD